MMILLYLLILSSPLSTFKNLKNILTTSISTLVSQYKKYSEYDPHDGRQMLRGEIVALNHYHSSRGKTRGQGWHLIISHKELPSFSYFIITIQVVSKRSYKWKWER